MKTQPNTLTIDTTKMMFCDLKSQRRSLERARINYQAISPLLMPTHRKHEIAARSVQLGKLELLGESMREIQDAELRHHYLVLKGTHQKMHPDRYVVNTPELKFAEIVRSENARKTKSRKLKSKFDTAVLIGPHVYDVFFPWLGKRNSGRKALSIVKSNTGALMIPGVYAGMVFEIDGPPHDQYQSKIDIDTDKLDFLRDHGIAVCSLKNGYVQHGYVERIFKQLQPEKRICSRTHALLLRKIYLLTICAHASDGQICELLQVSRKALRQLREMSEEKVHHA